MEGTKLEGKDIAIFYDDGGNHISRKDGKCTAVDSESFTLDKKIIIPKARVVRIELK